LANHSVLPDSSITVKPQAPPEDNDEKQKSELGFAEIEGKPAG